MYFQDMDSLVHMDGHGAFVWAAYAIAVAVIALMVAAPARRRRRLLRELAGEARRNGAGGER